MPVCLMLALANNSDVTTWRCSIMERRAAALLTWSAMM
jgi:hypothetical protein